jgi:hypothetical protein
MVNLDDCYINLDLDGVMVDFYGETSRILGANYKSLPSAQAWSVLEKIPHFFEKLPMLPDALELWKGLEGRGRPSRVLTAVPKPTGLLNTAPGDKRIWVRENISRTVPVLIAPHGAAKAEWARPGHILIDDLQRNIDAWVAAGGIGILHRSARETLEQLDEHAPLLQAA